MLNETDVSAWTRIRLKILVSAVRSRPCPFPFARWPSFAAGRESATGDMPHLEPATSYEVIVVGAGAAGLLAASCSAERGRRTLLIEKNRKPGVKILMSGGTRCNITHNCDAAGIIAAFGSAGPFLHSPLAALSPQGLLDLLHEQDLATKVELGGKIFPQSDRAADVLNALLRRFHRSGAELALGEP